MLQETATILKPLVSALPGLETIIHGDPIHPYKLFVRLCDVVGDLATLRLSQIPPVLPTYQHNDLNACFEPVLALAKQYLNSIDLSFSSFPFQQKDRLFYLRLHQNYLQGKLYIGIRAPKGVTEIQLEEWMNDSIICSDFSIETVRARRITGNERKILRNEELYDLMPSRGVVIFEFTPDPEYIKADQNLNIFNPADHPDKRPTEIVLYVRKVEETQG
jgi:type VI secretion system protein ImpJ